MTRKIRNFADILHPVTPAAFFAEYHDKKPLHIPGAPDKFASVMSWQSLNGLLNMTTIWSAASLQLVLDKAVIPAAQYCRPGIDRNKIQVMQPDAARVTALLRQGASLVANDVDALAPGLRAVSEALEAALGAKAQANLYCSWRQRQAFDSHFDTHDVYVLHVEGEKVWRVYQTRVDTPIAHPRFKSYGQAHHDRAKGKVLMDITMRPGDLLYLPRGQYHDALASSAGTLHASFGLTAVIGIDFVDLIRDMAIEDSLFRANVPAPATGEAPVATHVRRLAARLGELAASPEALDRFTSFQRGFRYARGGFRLPEAATVPEFRVRGRGLKVVKSGSVWALVDKARSVPIPPGGNKLVAWVIDRERFSGDEIAAAFPDTAIEERTRMLRDLAAMKVIEPA
ncbi:MAG: cupin domain-containing protein [Kiloniellaceae bacterium]